MLLISVQSRLNAGQLICDSRRGPRAGASEVQVVWMERIVRRWEDVKWQRRGSWWMDNGGEVGLGRADPGATLLGTDRLDDPEHGIIGAAMVSGIDFAGSLSEFSTPKIYIITEPYNPILSLILRYLNGTLGRCTPNMLEPETQIA